MRVLTFDIEDWFHILDNPETSHPNNWLSYPSRVENGTRELLDTLDRKNQKATFFVLGWIARYYSELVAEIEYRGHEIACHSNMHELVYRQSPYEFESDLVQAMNEIYKACGVMPTAYRAPGFSITNQATWAFDILCRNGITVDCSVFPAPRGHGGLPGFPYDGPCLLKTRLGNTIKCLPINVRRVVGRGFVYSGGGYFRLCPYFLLKHFFRVDEYIMTYFHPRDFDDEQPEIPGLSRIRRFKSNVGIKGASAKLDSLLSEFDFITLEEASSQIDWNRRLSVQI